MHKGTSKHRDDNKFEQMQDGAAILNYGQKAGDFDHMGVGELMSIEVPTQQAESPPKKTRRQQRARPIQRVIRLKSSHAFALPDQHSQEGGHRRLPKGAARSRSLSPFLGRRL